MHSKTLLIIGASGHGRAVADIAQLIGYTRILFFDDNTSIKACGGHPVVGKTDSIVEYEGDVFIALGNPNYRKRFMEKLTNRFFPVLVHPKAVIARDVHLGAGTVVMAGSVINPNATIGKGGIVNTCSSVDHDCLIGDYVHVAVGAHICGAVNIGDCVWVGAGAIVINNLRIEANTIVGAGAVVVDDIEKAGVYLGVPAREEGAVGAPFKI